MVTAVVMSTQKEQRKQRKKHGARRRGERGKEASSMRRTEVINR